jgi:hypothetical protein
MVLVQVDPGLSFYFNLNIFCKDSNHAHAMYAKPLHRSLDGQRYCVYEGLFYLFAYFTK